MQDIQVFEGQLSHVGGRYLIVVSRFNAFVVEPMLAGAIDTLKRSGVDSSDITIVRVPGAYELPIACRRAAEKLKPDAVIALGAVIRGSTAHFDFVAGESCKGIASVGLEIDCPVAFGVITTDTIEQAIERAGSKAGNKGSEAAHTALEMVSLFQAIDEI